MFGNEFKHCLEWYETMTMTMTFAVDEPIGQVARGSTRFAQFLHTAQRIVVLI